MNKLTAVIRRHWKPLLALNAAVLAFAALGVLSLEDQWSAQAQLIIPNTTDDLSINLGTLGDLQGGEGLVFSQQLDSRKILLSILLSDETVEAALEKDVQKESFERLSDFKGLLDANASDTSTVLTITAEGSEAEIVEGRLQNWIQAFQNRLNELRRDDINSRIAFLGDTLYDAEQQLEIAQARLVEFQSANNLIDGEVQIQELVIVINNLERIQGETFAAFSASEARLNQLVERLGQTPEQAIVALELAENQGYQGIIQKLNEVNIALLENQAVFTDEYPLLQDLLIQRDALLEQQAQYITFATTTVGEVKTELGENSAALIQDLILTDSETQALRAQSVQLQAQLDDLVSQLNQLPETQAQLFDLQRQYNNAEGVYNALIAQEQAIRISAFSAYPSVQVLDSPRLSPFPLGPGKRPIALGAILASAFGSSALILFLENKNPILSIKYAYQLEQPIIGKIVQLPLHYELEILQKQLDFQQLAVFVEKHFAKGKSFLVGSPAVGEGKTTVTLGISLALSEIGFKILVIDGDSNGYSLSKQLIIDDQADTGKEALLSTTFNNIFLLKSSFREVQSKKYLTQGKLREQISRIQESERFDYILIDGLPFSSYSEAITLASSADNIFLVLWPEQSSIYALERSLELLHQNSIQVSGLILNGLSDREIFNQTKVQHIRNNTDQYFTDEES